MIVEATFLRLNNQIHFNREVELFGKPLEVLISKDITMEVASDDVDFDRMYSMTDDSERENIYVGY
jgi:hypothetical protein